MNIVAALGALLAIEATPAPNWTLTPSGWGPVRIGMSRAQVSKALNVELVGDSSDDFSCQELIGADDALPGLYFMFENGKLTRITATEFSTVATPRGLHFGSTEEEVRKAYGEGLKIEPHHYLDAPARYLTFWIKPERSGVRFETDIHGKVESIDVGTSSIQYVEGCH